MKNNTGYIVAPNDSGWIWEWSFALNPQSDKGQEVVDYMMWASSKDYVDLTMGLDSTGASTPSGIRTSTYERDDYKGLSYAAATLARSRVQSLNWKATLARETNSWRFPNTASLEII